MQVKACRDNSTKQALEAPRESASKPREPEPAYKSKTDRLSELPKMENMASRTRSVVARVPLGTRRGCPRQLPEMILMESTKSGNRALVSKNDQRESDCG